MDKGRQRQRGEAIQNERSGWREMRVLSGRLIGAILDRRIASLLLMTFSGAIGA